MRQPSVRPERLPAESQLSRLLILLLLAYPFALHLGVLNDWLLPALLLLLGLLLLSGLLMLIRGNRFGWLLLPLPFAAASGLTASGADPELLLKLPPVLINGVLCLLFGLTLSPGQRPLVSRFAEIVHGHALDFPAQRYTRGVTQLWTGLFALMTLESLLLGLFADVLTWSIFTNFINYLVVALVFLLEYRVRLRRLPHLDHPGFAHFLMALRRIDWRRLL